MDCELKLSSRSRKEVARSRNPLRNDDRRDRSYNSDGGMLSKQRPVTRAQLLPSSTTAFARRTPTSRTKQLLPVFPAFVSHPLCWVQL